MEYIHPIERRVGASQEPYGLAFNEVQSARERGWDTTALHARLQQIVPDPGTTYAEVIQAPETDVTAFDHELCAFYEDIPRGLPEDSPFFEASDWASIDAALPAAPDPVAVENLERRIEGAWYGRVAGNMLGKPVEADWPRAKLTAYLEANDALPLDDYIPLTDPGRAREVGFWVWEGLTRGRVDGGVRDDDIDYTVLGLHLLETFGPEYTTFDVASQWLTRFPLLQLFTAERAAYNNLVRGVPLDLAGEHRNPYREWIGALIRGDIFGYVHAGDPRAAARLAHPDAWLSHRANGIYGELWAAALVASAFTAPGPEESVRASLDHIPADSRLSLEIRTVLDDFVAGVDWDQALDRLDARHPGMSWVHTINNAGALAAAILWGGGDFTSTIALAVRSGLDTDSIGATAGSWAGAFVGIDGVPERWLKPLGGRTESAIVGFSAVSLDDVTRRTIAFARRVAEDSRR